MAENKDHTGKNTAVLECVCEHPFQDQRYGKGKRLHNPRKDGKYCCTVCGREIQK